MPEARKIEFKQYGLQRTGTCLLKILVERHLDRLVHSEALGDKHHGFNKRQFDLYKANGAGYIKLLISIKNPYAWVVSFSKWTVKHQVFTDEGVLPLSEVSVDTIKRWCDTYNYLYKHWVDLPYEKEVVCYEDLVRNCRRTLDRIRDKWKLRYKSFPTDVDFIVRPGQEVSYKLFDPTYYFENRYMLELSDEQVQAVHDNIDWRFFACFGYNKTPPKYHYIDDYQI